MPASVKKKRITRGTWRSTPPGRFDLVAIGVSTGGPSTLRTLFGALPDRIPYIILVVQHISPGYDKILIKSLQQVTSVPIELARSLDSVAPGRIVFSKADLHLEVTSTGRIRLASTPPRNHFRPSIDQLFESVARNFAGKAVGIILTGMGGDGAAGTKALRAKGHPVVIQDEETSVVWGMGREVADGGSWDAVLPLPLIGRFLAKAAGADESEAKNKPLKGELRVSSL